jgi:DNA polymerase V
MSQFPSPAQDYELNLLSLDRLLRPTPACIDYKRLHEKDDSMIGEGIMPGSIIVVNNALYAKDRCWVYAIVDRQKIVRTFFEKAHHIELHPNNPFKDYPIIHLPKGEGDWVIIGVVTASVLQHKFK